METPSSGIFYVDSDMVLNMALDSDTDSDSESGVDTAESGSGVDTAVSEPSLDVDGKRVMESSRCLCTTGRDLKILVAVVLWVNLKVVVGSFVSSLEHPIVGICSL